MKIFIIGWVSTIIVFAVGVLSGIFIFKQDPVFVYVETPSRTGGYEVPTIVTHEDIIKSVRVDPVDTPVVTSKLGIRISPITGKNSIHYATDMYSNKSMNVYAVADGVVVLHYPPPNGYFKGHPVYGGLIEILHSDGLSRYGHMSKTFIQEGQKVKAGDVIGIIGDTGLSRGLHLDYTFFEKSY